MSDQPPTIDTDPDLPVSSDGASPPPPLFNDAWPQMLTVTVTEEQLRRCLSLLRVTL
jgi:hypothetical protein